MLDLIRVITINGALNSLPLSMPIRGSYFINNNKMPSTNVVIANRRICSVPGYKPCFSAPANASLKSINYVMGEMLLELSHCSTIKSVPTSHF